MKRLIHIAIGAAVIVGLYFALEAVRKQKAEEPRPEIIRPVKTVTLSANGQGGVWTYFGTLQGGKRVDLSFRVSGPIKSILVEKGASVKQGDLLATLDPRDFQTQLKQAQSNQAQAKAQYDDAQANFKRYENLYKQKVVPKATYDTQKTQVDVTRSALNAAIAQTAAVRDSLKDTELRAPFDGVIVDRMVENFQDITAKQPIFSLQDISTLEIVFNVPDNDVIWGSQSKAKPTSIQARFDAIPGRAFPVTLKEFVIQADPNTNTFPVTATMPQQKDVALLPGMAATVELVFEDEREGAASFRVPASALLHDGYVWRCVDGQVHRVPILFENPHNDGTVNISGPDLQGGDVIVVAGVQLLREGQKVRVR